MNSLERKIFEKTLSRLRGGRLMVAENGRLSTYGEEATDGLEAMIEIKSPAFYRRAIFGGEIGFGESFMDGDWSSPDLVSLVRLAVRNLHTIDGAKSPLAFLSHLLHRAQHVLRDNSIRGSKRNIRAHYDLSNDFFALFLDRNLMYSAARWEDSSDTLEKAQIQKIDRICRLLQLSPADHVLEIGTGWGGFALQAASLYGCRITTTTISDQQYELACRRVEQAGLQDRITVLKQDYRLLNGQFDKAVSIEMFEAVGLDHYDDYFAAVGRLVKPGGAMLLQTITMNERNFATYRRRTDWIQQYIFPGGELGSVVEIQRSLARTGLFQMHDFAEMGQHYARTLREWRRRFHEAMPKVLAMGFDERFCRMWDYYLAYCEGAFLERYIGVVQMLLVHASAPEGVHGEPWKPVGSAHASGNSA